MIKIKIDIIGGGISGISAGISLKKNDRLIEVIIHEKHKNIGFNHEGRRCGEAHNIESEFIPDIPDQDSIFNNITKVEITIGERKRIYNKEINKTFILNRQKYIHKLGNKAEELGVIILTDDKIKSVNDLSGDYIIDASGCPSIVKRELGLNHGIIGDTYQQTLENSNKFISDTVKIIYSDFGGYFWIFPRNPKKNEINLGVGSIRKFNLNLKNMLENFKEKQDIKGKINYVTGGLIPIGIQRPLRYNNILFIGDAGLGAFPITGQGIYRALISGDIAGKAIAMKKPKNYSHWINKIYLRWDLICKSYIKLNFFLRKINPKLLISSLNLYFDFLKTLKI